jgi:pimeloyl-ACP methyl ester carboxylesterase
MRTRAFPVTMGLAAFVFFAAASARAVPAATDGHVLSADGVRIAYSVRGEGPIALVFVHGALADRTFWRNQLAALSDRFTVVALDLGGHGESGRDRKAYSLASWAADVRAVVETLGLRRVVLVGNSLGGPVVLEAAPLLKGRVLGVVGVDTLHDARLVVSRSEAQERAAAFRKDFGPGCRALVDSLFHPGAQKVLHTWVEGRMCAGPVDLAARIIEGIADIDMAAIFRKAGVPIRAINGDLWPTGVEGNRKVTPDFDAVVKKDAGHFPMLERPDEFDRDLVALVKGLEKAK